MQWGLSITDTIGNECIRCPDQRGVLNSEVVLCVDTFVIVCSCGQQTVF